MNTNETDAVINAVNEVNEAGAVNTDTDSDTEVKTLNDYHKEVLRRSGWNDTTIADSRWYSASEEIVIELLAYAEGARPGPGMVIPFPYSDYFTVRLDKPMNIEGKEQRYANPKNTPAELYFPKTCNYDGNGSIYITEGSKKAEAIAQLGFNVIGLPGVSMWSDPDAAAANLDKGIVGRVLRSEIKELLTGPGRKSRSVTIVFDAPDMNIWGLKPAVVREAVALSKAIAEAGGVPSIAILPWKEYCEKLGNPGKAGIDDVLYELGEMAVKNCLNQAVFAEPSKLIDSYRKGTYLNFKGEFWDSDEDKREPTPTEVKWIVGWLEAWHGGGSDGLKALAAHLKKLVGYGWLTADEREEILESATNRPGDKAREYIRKWLATCGRDYSYKTEGIRGKKYRSVYEAMILDKPQKLKDIGENLIKYSFNEWRLEQDAKFLAWIQMDLGKYSGAYGNEVLGTFVKCIRGDGPGLELDIAVVRHFVWQIKRKLAGGRVEHHMMTILFGETGGGKTEAIMKLLEPVQELVTSMNLAILGDERQYSRLERNYVVFIDEMDNKEGKIDGAALKKVISTVNLDWRILGENKEDTAKNNATIIGSTNKEIRDVIKDPTSARRYWQINCLPLVELSKNHNTINNLDYAALWRSVSVDETCPILKHLDEIRRIQERDIRSKSMLEEFLATEATIGGWTKTTDVYEAYKTYLKSLGMTHFPTISKFGRDMGALKLKAEPRDGKNKYPVTLGKNESKEEQKVAKVVRLWEAKNKEDEVI